MLFATPNFPPIFVTRNFEFFFLFPSRKVGGFVKAGRPLSKAGALVGPKVSTVEPPVEELPPPELDPAALIAQASPEASPLPEAAATMVSPQPSPPPETAAPNLPVV